MYSLIVVFCGVASSGYTDCYHRSALEFQSKSACQGFISNGDRRWGEGFVVAYCVQKRGK